MEISTGLKFKYSILLFQKNVPSDMNYIKKILNSEGSSGCDGWVGVKREQSRENAWYDRLFYSGHLQNER